MASSSCDSEEEICWWRTKNLIKERLIDGSLIHTLQRAPKLQKETKQINYSLRNYVKRKLREQREKLNNTDKHKNNSAHDVNTTTDSESSGVDDVFMMNCKPSTSARARKNRPTTSRHSLNKANVKSNPKVTTVSKNILASSKKTGQIKKQNSSPKAINENDNVNANKILRSTRQRPKVSLNSADKKNITLTHEENRLSDKPSVTPPVNNLNGLLNGKNNENSLTNSNQEIRHTLNSINLNIISEEIMDPVRRLPKGPATIKKNLFNIVRNAKSDAHESQEIISSASARFNNQSKDKSNASSTIYDYSSTFDACTGLSKNGTLSSDDIGSWLIDTTCNFTKDSTAEIILSSELTTHDNALSEEKTITAMNTLNAEERMKNDSIISVESGADNSILDDNNDIKINEIQVLNRNSDSEDISRAVKGLPDNNSSKCGSFHENDNVKEDSDLQLKKSSLNTSDNNNLPEKLNNRTKCQENNVESSEAQLLNDVQNSVLISKNVEDNFSEEIKSPERSLSLSGCGSVSGDDSIRTRFVPKVKSSKILNTRYKIVKLHEESDESSLTHSLTTSSPNPKSLYVKSNTVNEHSKATNIKLEDPKSKIKTGDNSNVSEGLEKSSLKEGNNSHTAINIDHPKKIYDSYKENSECSNGEKADVPIEQRTLNCDTGSESQDFPLEDKEHFTYSKTSHSREILCEEDSRFQHEKGRTNRRNSQSFDEVNDVPNTEVTSDQEIENDSNVSPTHLSSSNRILSDSFTGIQSLRRVAQTFNTRKKKSDQDVLKEYEDQFLNKHAQQPPSESINTVRNGRPAKIQDVIIQSNFTEEEAVTSLTMNDISDDDEIFIFEIPKTVDVQNFRDQKFMFEGDNDIVIGGKKFEIYERENRSMSIVLNKGDLKRSYGAVNLKAVRSVYMRPKMLKKEIETLKVDREVRVPKSSTVPFPKNLRFRHPLLGTKVTKEISVSEENEEIAAATSNKVLKWLISQDQDVDEDPMMIGEPVKSRRKQITNQEDENVAMRNEESDDDLESSRKKRRLKSTNDKHNFK